MNNSFKFVSVTWPFVSFIDIKPEDSGNYTCEVRGIGSVTHQLIVRGKYRHWSDLEGGTHLNIEMKNMYILFIENYTS